MNYKVSGHSQSLHSILRKRIQLNLNDSHLYLLKGNLVSETNSIQKDVLKIKLE